MAGSSLKPKIIRRRPTPIWDAAKPAIRGVHDHPQGEIMDVLNRPRHLQKSRIAPSPKSHGSCPSPFCSRLGGRPRSAKVRFRVRSANAELPVLVPSRPEPQRCLHDESRGPQEAWGLEDGVAGLGGKSHTQQQDHLSVGSGSKAAAKAAMISRQVTIPAPANQKIARWINQPRRRRTGNSASRLSRRAS